MSGKNIELVRRFYEEMWNRFDTTLFPEILHSGIRFRGSLGQEKIGYDELAEYVGFIKTFSGDFHNEVTQTITEGDWTFARLSYSGTHTGAVFGVPAAGKRFEYSGAAVFRITDDRISEVWVLGDIHGLLGQLREHGNPVEIVDYRDDWPDAFAELASTLRSVLGETALRIDHIGSTSVSGLAAKDRIDVQVTTEGLQDERLRPPLESAGFIWLPEFSLDHQPAGHELATAELEKRVATTAPDRQAANIHIRVEGRFNQRWALLFRDYLRSHPSAATAYAAVKRHLAEAFPGTQLYSVAKDPIIDLIMAAAEEWAGAMTWEPAPPDA